MKETNISDEMLFRFLEGKMDETEEVRLLRALEMDGLTADDLVAIAEAAKLTDTTSHQAPNLDLAKEQIAESLGNDDKVEIVTTLKRSKTHMIWAIAASAAIVIAVALFFHFRPDSNDQNFAQQEDKRVEEVSKEIANNPNTTDETDKGRHGEKSSTKSAENIQSEPEDLQTTPITPQKVDKNYATTKTANSLTVTKPNKDNYQVLCKNLEKSLIFEWNATNVQRLNLTVTNAQGKKVADVADKNLSQYSLKYKDAYPEKQLNWTLKVVFEDGTSESRSGQIQIDYQIQ